MGMFKDVRKLNKQAKDISKNWDPAAQRAQANARMAAASENLAQQTRTAQLLATGERGQATITAVRDTGMFLNMQPVIHVDLLFMADGRPPVAAYSEGPVLPTALARLVPGAEVQVCFDATNPSVVAIDWTRS